MLKFLTEALRSKYYPLNLITVSKKNLTENYLYLSKINPQIAIAPVLKSNAYGHGAKIIAKILDDLNPPFLCVDSLSEAYELQKAKIKSPILIMGFINGENLKVKPLSFSYAVYDLDLLKIIDTFQPGAQVHIKVDTGMHRLGVPLENLNEFVKKALKFKNIQIVGIMSHLATADKPKEPLLTKQITCFQEAIRIVESQGVRLQFKHLVASDGLINLNSKVAFTNISRVGLALYGINAKDENLLPVLQLQSQIVQIKKIKKGERIGYSGTFTAPKDMVLGILPIGYNDGVDLRLSNKGYVIVNSKKCLILGRISMNITAIDLTQVKNPKIGDKVVIFSKNPNEVNSIEKSASICKTIPYELLIHLSPTSIRREII